MGVNCIDFSTLTVSDTAVTLMSASPRRPVRAKGAVITIEDAGVRYRIDGDAPTSTEGHLLNSGDVQTFDSWTAPGNNWQSVLDAIQYIRTDSDAKLKISWFD